MQKILKFFLFFILPFNLAAQQYDVFQIPDSLLKKANAVNRYSEMRFSIQSDKKATLYEKQVYTILNEAGDKYADYLTRYDKFTSINDLDGNLYNAAGKKIKEVKKKDISDHPAYDGYSLMQDARYKEHNFYYKDYPYTVEYEEADDWNQMFYLPTWDPKISQFLSVLFSNLFV
jgi:hypothetical protein